jgi:hypothetical protein
MYKGTKGNKHANNPDPTDTSVTGLLGLTMKANGPLQWVLWSYPDKGLKLEIGAGGEAGRPLTKIM